MKWSWSVTGLKGPGSTKLRRKDCPRLVINSSVEMSLVWWAVLLSWQWRSTVK